MGRLFRNSGHLVRVAGLFVAGIAVFLALRGLLLPEGFGVYGHFRAGALDDNRTRPLVYAGRAACLECHTDAGDTLAGGTHSRVGCEGCHGPLARHAEDPSALEAVRPDSRALCRRCHQTNLAKPAGFPQVALQDHAPDGACSECHVPHAPGLD